MTEPINVPLKASLDGAGQVKSELENIKRLMAEVANMDPKGKLKGQLGQLTTSFQTLGASLGGIFGNLSKGLETELQGAQAKAKAGGKKIVKELQDEVDKTSVKVRISSTTVLLPNGVKAKVSGDISDIKELTSAFDTLMGRANSSSADTNARILKDVRYKKLELDQRIEVAKSILDASKLGMSNRDLETQFGPRAVRASKRLAKMEAEQDARDTAQIDRDLETQLMVSSRKLAAELAKLDAQTKLEKLQRGNATDAEDMKRQIAVNASTAKLDAQTKLDRMQRGNQADAEDMKRKQAAAQARLSATAAELSAVSAMEIQEERARRLRKKQDLADELRDRDLNARFSQLSPAAQLTRATRVASIATDAQGSDFARSRYGSAAVDAASPQAIATLAAEVAKLDTAKKQLSATKAAGVKPTKDLEKAHLDLGGGVRELHSGVRGLASGFGAMWLTWGSILPLMAGAAVSNAAVQAVKLGADVGQALTTIQTLGGASSSEIAELNAVLLETARSGPFGPGEVAKALRTLALAGLSAKEQMQALKPVMDFAVVGDMGIEDAAENLVAVSTAFGYQAKDMSVASDIIAKTAAISMASTTGMASSFKVASVVAEQYRVSLTDVATSLALLAQIGIKDQAAGTAVRNMYTELMGTSQKARAVMKDVLKFDVYDKDDKLKKLPDIFNSLAASLVNMKKPSQDAALAALGNERGTKALAAGLAAVASDFQKSGDSAEVYANKLVQVQKQLDDAPGFSAISAIGMASSTLNQLKQTSSTLQAALVDAFQAAEPAILRVVLAIREGFNSESFKSAVSGIVTAVADLTSWLVKHAGTILDAAKAYLVFKTATVTYGVAMAGVSAAVAFLSTNFARSVVLAASMNVALGATTVGAYASATAMGVLNAVMRLNPLVLIATLLAAAGSAFLLFAENQKAASDAGKASAADLAASTKITSDSLDAEIKRLDLLIEAKGIRVKADELEAQSVRDKALEGVAANSALQISSLEAAKARQIQANADLGWLDNLGLVSKGAKQANADRVADIDEQIRLVKRGARAQQDDLAAKFQMVKDKARLAAKLADDNKRPPLPTGPGTFDPDSLSGRKGAGAATKDNTAQQLMKRYETEMSTLDALESNKAKVLNAQRSANLISQEGFYAEEITLAAQTEQAKLKIIEDEDQARQKAYFADIQRVSQDKHEKDKIGKFRVLANAYITDNEKFIADREKVEGAAATREVLQEIKLQGDLRKIKTDAREFEQSEAIADAKRRSAVELENESRFANPEQALVLKARATEYERLSGRVDEYERSIQNLNTALADDIAYRESFGPLSEDARAAIAKETDAVNKLVAAKRSAKEALKGQIPGRVNQAGVDAQEKIAKDLLGDLYKDTRSSLSSAIGDSFSGNATKPFILAFGDSLKTVVYRRLSEALADSMLGSFGSGGSGGSGIMGLLQMGMSLFGPTGASLGGTGQGTAGGAGFGVNPGPGATFDIDSFAVGTDYVPNDMIAQIHKGERIIPAEQNARMQRNFDGGGQQEAQPVVNVTQNFTVGDVASKADLIAAVSGSERRISANFDRARRYNGVK